MALALTLPQPPKGGLSPSVTPFSLIVATDSRGGIAENGAIPWNSRADRELFKRITRGPADASRPNVVIMGRKTYDSLPSSVRPLPDRINVVISTSLADPKVTVVGSLREALSINHGSGEVFVIGGERVYREAMSEFSSLCTTVHITTLADNWDCDQFFPMVLFNRPLYAQTAVINLPDGVYCRYDMRPSPSAVPESLSPPTAHPEPSGFTIPQAGIGPGPTSESAYLDLLRRILREGEDRPDRTGVGTRALFGTTLEFDLTGDLVPFLTTKKVSISNVLKELLWMLSGSTDSKRLEAQGVTIWKGNTTTEFLKGRGLDYPEGDIGAGYGFQWRHWGADYHGGDGNYNGQGVDQIAKVIEGLQRDPFGRRHLVSAWNVSDLDKMALPPCHLLMQFNVAQGSDVKTLDLQVYMRSCDTFLGLPYNLGFYGCLLHMVAHLCQMRGRKLRMVMGDTHIYSNHRDQVQEQLTRPPYPWPTLKITERIQKIEDFTLENLLVQNYTSWPALKAPMAV